MRPHDDDLHAWRDDPLLRALTAPGSGAELAGESDALAAFRAAAASRRRGWYAGRLGGRLGVTGTALGAAVVLSAGAAAAYSGTLPATIQRPLHEAFGAIGVPAPHHHPRAAVNAGHRSGAGWSLTSQSPTATSSAAIGSPQPARQQTTKAHRRHATSQIAARGGHAPRPSAQPSTTPAPVTATSPPVLPSPTPTPTGTPPPTTTGSITIAVSASSVPAGGNVTVTGRLAGPDGTPVAGRTLWLVEREAGQGASRVVSATTGDDGTVSLTSPALEHTARLRLAASRRTHSAALRVIVRPALMVSVASGGSGEATIHVTASGGDPGDMVSIQRRSRSGWRDVAANQLDGSDAATFGVTPPKRRDAHYRAVLPRTPAHAGATTWFVVPPG